MAITALIIGATVVGGAGVAYSTDQQRKSAHEAIDAQRAAAAALSVPEPPTVSAPVPTMPTPGLQSETARAARRASIAEQMRRRGRASTILTGASSDVLGGG